jgi:hypothetical protein
MNPVDPTKRKCQAANKSGSACGSHPMVDHDYCFLHSPDHSEEAARARSIGGHRRKRDQVIQVTYDLGDLNSLEGLLRLLDVAALDALGLENSLARSKVLVSIVRAGATLLPLGELDQRLTELERIQNRRDSL